MERQSLLDKLRVYTGATDEERRMVTDTINFVERNPMCFERSLLEGHVTGSAWIVNSSRTHVLLIHHKKLDKWFQPGGHCDGNSDVLAVAMKEATEETGLTVKPVRRSVFDVDNHVIPARGEVPEHVHYDIRFLLEADAAEDVKLNREVKAIRWVPLADTGIYNASESIMRMARKQVV
jgi:8-oxo-dGTP pyrophosphatase MutT (NUDIX family)